jgi:adenine-specific DNA-methyltransferase
MGRSAEAAMTQDVEMNKIESTDAVAKSADLVAESIAQLKALFPELITESSDGAAVNLDVLKQLVGDATLTDAEEKYGLNWHGKRRARQLALTPSAGTLRPCPDDSVDWDTTQNLMIEGDNLEVLKLLQKSYVGKVRLIYIDPPYNTGRDFVYPDNFQDSIKSYLELTGQVEGGAKMSSNTEASGRFHTDWLNMMYPRLKLAKNLLEPQGVILISIGDGEAGNLRAICDEVIGEECFICQFTWVKKRKGSHLSDTHRSMTEYVLAYARDKTGLSLFGEAAYSEKLQPLAKKTNAIKELVFPEGSVKTTLDDGLYEAGNRGEGDSSLSFKSDFRVSDGMVIDELIVEGPFVWTQLKLTEELGLGTTVHLSSKFGFNVGRHDQGDKFKAPSTLIQGIGTNEDAFEELTRIFGVERVFDFTKPTSLIQYLVNSVTYSAKGGVILDFFAGSGTTGQAVMGLNAQDDGNRRFVLVQIPELLDADNDNQKVAATYCKKLKKPLNIAELTKERLRRAGAKVKDANPEWQGDTGFRVYKLDQSNIRAWQPSGNLEKDLIDSVEHIIPGRSERDVLTELLLRLGLDLCVPIEQRQIANKTVHAIGGGVLMACLNPRIGIEDAETLALGIAEWHQALEPAGDTTCVFRDSAFENDEAKTNLAAILEQHGIHHVRSL